MAIKIINRSMDIPISDRTVGYKGDNLVEIRTFELNRFYGDIDLSEFDFKLDTEINGTKNIIDLDKAVTEDKITLTWTVRESHILHPGRMSIQIRAFSQGEEKWYSAVDYVIVQSSINATEVQPDPLPSEFIQMEQRVTAAKNQAQAAAQTATEQAGIATTKAQEAKQQAERVEDIIHEAEQDVLPELRQAIEDGIETKDQLDGSISAAGPAKTGLDGSISSAGVAKTQLDGSISSANGIKSQLDGSITTAEQTKQALDESIATGDLDSFKADYMQFKNDSTLKSVKIEKELNDYKAVLSQLNPNQEAKQSVFDYGTVSLPVNAANGQFSDVRMFGRSLKNEVNYNRETWAEWTNVGTDGVSANSSGLTITGANKSCSIITQIKPSTKYGILLNVVSNSLVGTLHSISYVMVDTSIVLSGITGNVKHVFTSNASITTNRFGFFTVASETGSIKIRDVRVFELPPGSEIESDFTNLTADQLAVKYPYIQGGSPKSTVSAMRIVSESEDETQRMELYIPDVGELRSTDTVQDEISFNRQTGQWVHIKRVDDNGEALSNPTITPISVSGTLLSYPKGTVYSESVLPVAGLYTTNGISVTNTDFPIESIERIHKIDFATGVETEINPSSAVVAGNGLSFTHPDLAEGDIVFFTYYHNITGTNPKLTLTYYDSRYTVKDSVNNKFYKWKITVANGVPSIAVEEVS